jgi:hypothetical protein
MNSLLMRWFIAPEGVARPPAPYITGLLASASDLPAAAGGLAAELRARHRSATALVCGPTRTGLSTPAATKLARRLARRDLAATAAGALCHVELTHARRAIAAAGVPAIIAVSARDAESDELLNEVDRLAIALRADADSTYADLTAASLSALGTPCDRIVVPDGLAARRLASLGLTRLRPLPAEVRV